MILNKENNPKGLNIDWDIMNPCFDIIKISFVVTCRYNDGSIDNLPGKSNDHCLLYSDRTSIFNLKSWGPRGYQAEE